MYVEERLLSYDLEVELSR